MQTKYCQKLSRLNNITYASRNLFTVRIIQWRTVMWCIPHLSKCPPFSGTVILMTFACALKTATLLSRNFISISVVKSMRNTTPLFQGQNLRHWLYAPYLLFLYREMIMLTRIYATQLWLLQVALLAVCFYLALQHLPWCTTLTSFAFYTTA